LGAGAEAGADRGRGCAHRRRGRRRPGNAHLESVAARPAATGPAGSSVSARASVADVAVRPGAQHAGRVQASPPATAGCEQLYKGRVLYARPNPGPATSSGPATSRPCTSQDLRPARPAAIHHCPPGRGPQKALSTERAELRALISR